jgi:hypothetical protein
MTQVWHPWHVSHCVTMWHYNTKKFKNATSTQIRQLRMWHILTLWHVCDTKSLQFFFKWLPVTHKMPNDAWHYLLTTFLTTFWQLFNNFLTTFLTTFWQLFCTFLTTFWQLFDNFLTTFFLLFDTKWHLNTFVTPQVFQCIGPSNDGRRHGRGTYLFTLEWDRELANPREWDREWEQINFRE